MDVDVALFFHICSVLLLFGSALLEITSLLALRRTSTVAIGRAWASLNRPLAVTFPVSAALLIVTGLYMLHQNPDFRSSQPWAMVTLVLLIVLSIVGAAFNSKRMEGIIEALRTAPDGPINADVHARIHESALLTSIMTMTGAVVAAVYLMTVKPGMSDSIIIAIIGMVLGAAVGQGIVRSGTRTPVVEPATS
jgi:outer membrane lipoprotein SlyB